MGIPEISSKKILDNLSEEEKFGLAMAKKGLGGKHNMTDEEWDRFISVPSNLKLVLHTPDMMKYRIVAECVESKFCTAGIKVGQKFIFSTVPNMFLPDESDAPPCIKALAPLGEHMHGIWERMFEELDPNEGMTYYVGCLDPGPEYAGMGHVVFRLYVEKKEEE